jgi:single-stranded-DNA-specific exonuclease
MTTYEWVVPEPLSKDALAALGDFSRPIAEALCRRGFTDRDAANRFLSAEGGGRIDPFRLKGMDAAADRLARAVADQEPIVVYGDYDADGVAATALMLLALKAAGAQVAHYIPNRFDEGYGLNIEAIRSIASAGTQLMVTVDCGIRSIEEVAGAEASGMDVVLTDHHHPGPELPPAYAIVNPNQPGDAYPFRGLSGVGLAYKLIKALEDRLPGRGVDAESYLDLVAVGTVADVSPLVDENRWLVSHGLVHIRQHSRPGMAALIDVARLKASSLLASNIAFGLGPRINAAGRLDSAELALSLLTAEDVRTAAPLARKLDEANRKRQKLTRSMVEIARTAGPWRADEAPVVFAVDPSFNEGVVGLAASRLVEEFLRPALVARSHGGLIKGSARSVPGFHITEALEACSDLLERFGGHAAAAGFVLKEESLDPLLERLMGVIEAVGVPELEKPILTVDAEVSASELDEALLDDLERFEPTGEGNAQPVFFLRGLRVVDKRAVGANGAHLKLTLASDRRVWDAIAFRQGGRAEKLPSRVDAVFHFERNEYLGRITPQLHVLDLRPAASS